MNRKLYWGLGVLIILILGVSAVLVIRHERATHKQLQAELDEANKLLEAQNKPSEVPAEKGHVHPDGTFHVGEHDDPLETPPSDWTPTQVQIPEGITDPDVKAAWKRLDDISRNRHKWGNFSPRTLELMDELTPVPSIYDTAEDGDCGEEIIFVLDELAKLRDPRSAELLVNYQMDSGVSGNPPDDALVAMGPASVLALVARLDDISGETSLSTPLDLLPRIVAAHRSELGGIVEHIIIPKIKAVAASEATVFFADGNKQLALNALEAILQKPKDQ